MSSNNHAHNRELQQDARAWAAFTGTKYTAALRQITSPFAQGLLGDRVSARHLIAVLDHHELVGADDDGPLLGDNGYYDETPWAFNGQTDFIELALLVDMLRMFTPTEAGTTPEVGSYQLKHTAERFLERSFPYVSNGRLIWAAAALVLDLVEPEHAGGGPNLLIGVSEREHHYVRKLVQEGERQLRAHHHRPPGLTHLQTALARCAAGEPPQEPWSRPVPLPVHAPFHDWLTAQVGRRDPIGHLANDYSYGVHDSDHGIASTPGDLLVIMREARASEDFYDAAVAAISEWFEISPAEAPLRTELISRDSRDVDGYGAGDGTVERIRYACPCGAGEIVEEHDNIPGFREHDVYIDCEKCRAQWRFADGRPVRGWGFEPAAGGGGRPAPRAV